MSKKIRKEILKLRSDLGDLDGYFYFKPVGHVLCGFLCEGRPNGIFVVPYAFPLYTGEKRIHLSYSKQLPYPENFIDSRKIGEIKAAAEFVEKMERYEAMVRAWQQLDNFRKHIETEDALENSWIRHGYAMTLVMLGEQVEAMAQIQILKNQSDIADYPGLDAIIAQVSSDIAQGLSGAKARLSAWEVEFKSRFGLN